MKINERSACAPRSPSPRVRGDMTFVSDALESAPYGGACSFVNAAMLEVLRKSGLHVHERHTSSVAGVSQQLLPWETAELGRDLCDSQATLITDRAVLLSPLQERPRTSIVVHGLAYSAALMCEGGWAGYFTNSRYTAACLAALRSRVPSSRLPASFLTVLNLPFPGELFPDGYPSPGEGFPVALRRLSKKTLLAHAVRPWKLDYRIFVSLIRQIGKAASRCGNDFKCVIFEGDAIELARTEAFRSIDRYILATPILSNTAMIALMRRAHFGLCFDAFPEPFGLYPLESVANGCPVFTNGVGNLRFLLPPSSGIRILDKAALYMSDKYSESCAKRIAEAIVTDVKSVRRVRPVTVPGLLG